MELRAIAEQNYQKILDLSTGAGQEECVARNVRSLAQAWVFRDRARPYALYEGEEPVGFIMLDWRPEEKTAEIWRFMINYRHQGKGYGRRAMELALEKIRRAGCLIGCSFTMCRGMRRPGPCITAWGLGKQAAPWMEKSRWN